MGFTESANGPDEQNGPPPSASIPACQPCLRGLRSFKLTQTFYRSSYTLSRAVSSRCPHGSTADGQHDVESACCCSVWLYRFMHRAIGACAVPAGPGGGNRPGGVKILIRLTQKPVAAAPSVLGTPISSDPAQMLPCCCHIVLRPRVVITEFAFQHIFIIVPHLLAATIAIARLYCFHRFGNCTEIIANTKC